MVGLCDHDALIGDAGEGEVFELADAFAEFFENVFNALHLLRFAAHGIHKIAQDFPVVVRLTRGDAGGVEALQATAEVDHGAAFFGERRARKHDSCGVCGGICQNVAVHVEVEFREIISRESGIADEVFAEGNERLDVAVANAVADGIQRA